MRSVRVPQSPTHTNRVQVTRATTSSISSFTADKYHDKNKRALYSLQSPALPIYPPLPILAGPPLSNTRPLFAGAPPARSSHIHARIIYINRKHFTTPNKISITKRDANSISSPQQRRPLRNPPVNAYRFLPAIHYFPFSPTDSSV